jgi:hypothetical protein
MRFIEAARLWDGQTFVPSRGDSCIKALEADDLIFEFAFPEYPGQDGCGEKGFENLEQNFYLPRRTGTPRLSRRIKFVSDTPLCPGKRNFLSELRAVFSFS